MALAARASLLPRWALGRARQGGGTGAGSGAWALGQSPRARAAPAPRRAASGGPQDEEGDGEAGAGGRGRTAPPTPPSSATPPPPPTPPSPPQRHWLARFGGVQEWLNEQNRHWWLTALRERCASLPATAGAEAELAERVAAQADRLVSRHAHRVGPAGVDDRGAAHLQLAALALATYTVVLPYLRGNQVEALELVRRQNGGEAAVTGVLGALNRAVGWLTPDPLALATRRLELLALDRGEAFGPRVEAPEGDGPGREAEFSACVYHAVFEAEGAPELLGSCCCAVDRAWFASFRPDALRFEMPASRAQGNSACVLSVTPR